MRGWRHEWEGNPKKRDMCICISFILLYCRNSTALWSNYTPVKKLINEKQPCIQIFSLLYYSRKLLNFTALASFCEMRFHPPQRALENPVSQSAHCTAKSAWHSRNAHYRCQHTVGLGGRLVLGAAGECSLSQWSNTWELVFLVLHLPLGCR